MNKNAIVQARYTIGGTIEVSTTDGVTIFVPNDAANADRQVLATWEAEGNTIEPYSGTPLAKG